MKKTFPIMLAFAIAFLFLIQAAGTLVESIYILDLMNSNLDAKVLGVLFFFSPVILIPFFKKYHRPMVWITWAILLVARGLLPWLNTSNRVTASGIATGAALGLLLLLLAVKPIGEPKAQPGLWSSAGLALAISLSIMLRTLDFGIDYSLTGAGGWAGVTLGLSLGWMLAHLERESTTSNRRESQGRNTRNAGIFHGLRIGVVCLFSSNCNRPVDGR